MNDIKVINVIAMIKFETAFPKDFPNIKEEAIRFLKHNIKECFDGEVYENTIRVEEVEE